MNKIAAWFTFFTLLAGSGWSQPSNCVPPPSGLVLWLPFDEAVGTRAANLAPGGNTGLITNSVTHSPGYVSGGLCFNGIQNEYAYVPDYPGINPGTGDFTLDAWIQGSYGGSTPRILLDKRNPVTGIGYSLRARLNKLELQLADAGGATDYLATVNMPADTFWHLVAVTVNRSATNGGRFYVDGVLTSTFDPTGRAGSLDNTNVFRIDSSPVNGNPFQGCMDEVEMFNRALTSNEIQGIFQAGYLGKCKPPIVLSNLPPATASYQCLSNVPAPPTVTATTWCQGGTNAHVSYAEVQSNPGSSCSNVIMRSWAAVDNCGNVTNYFQYITVNNDTPPVLTCASNKTVECGSGWSFDAPTATDVCNGTNVSITVLVLDTVTTGVCPQVITRTWLATDACGNTNTCSQTVTIAADTTPPVITCASNKTVAGDSNWTFNPPTATAACGGNSVAITVLGTETNGLCPLVITRTWLATDPCGNTNSCSQTVTVASPGPCQIFNTGMSGANGNLPVAPGNADPHFVLLSSPGAGTSCVVQSNLPGAWIPNGTSSRWIGPAINTASSPTGIYHYQLTFTLCCTNGARLSGRLAVDDTAELYLNGTPAAFPGSYTNFTPISITAGFIPGINTVDIYVTNIGVWTGLRAELTNCVGGVILACSTNKNVYCGTPWSFDPPTASSCCSNITFAVTSTVTNGVCPQIITRTWLATDICGNTNTCSQTVTVISCVPPPSGMVGWWPGDGDASDLLGNHPGSMQGGAGFTAGLVGQAFNFTGYAQFVEVPDAADLNMTNAISIDAWIKPNFAGGNMVIAEKATGGLPDSYYFGIYQGKLRLLVGNAGVLGLGSYFLSIQNIPANQWTHVAATYDGATLKLYLNGVLDNSLPVVEPFPMNTNPLRIGNSTPVGSEQFYGAIDEVELFNRILTSGEIAALYNAGPAGKCKTPQLVCATNKVVQCGDVWSFDAPVFNAPCNATNLNPSAVTTETNGLCPQLITRTWLFVDACGNSNTCSQSVTVLPECLPPPAGLVSWWPGNGNPNDVIGTNHGLLQGGATYTAGYVGQAFNFSGGSDHVSVPDSASLNITGPLTLEAWIRLSVVDTGPQSIVWKSDNGANSTSPYGLGVETDNRLFGTIGNGVSANLVHSTTSLQSNVWYHVVFVADGSSLKIYLNGVLDGTVPQTVTPAGTPHPFKIGEGVNAANSFCGWIDELSLYNRALTPGEIELIRALDMNGKCNAPLIACSTNKIVECGTAWSFDPPVVSETCGNANVTVTFTTLTNGACPQVITRTWLATDACGNTNTCSQTVTVVDTTPPVLICVSNKTVPFNVCSFEPGQGFSVLKNFNGGDGANPYGGLVEGSDGALYGTTAVGSSGFGAVFKLSRDGSGNYTVHTVLKNFTGSDGQYPYAGLAEGSDGALYGTTQGGGSSGVGTVFKLSTNSSGDYTVHTVLKNFTGSDGANPGSGLVEGSDGALYGTTWGGGSGGYGTVFKLSKDGGGNYTIHSVLKNFTTSDGHPYAALIEGSDGALYGTTVHDISNGYGTVFKMIKDVTGNYTIHTVLKNFTGSDGQSPYAGLLMGSDGALYGTTFSGGSSDRGTVFKLSTNSSGNYTIHTVLKSFTFSDGANPYAALVEGVDGELYGTTTGGGSSVYGTAFKLSKDSSGDYTVHTILKNFSFSDSPSPYAGLLAGSDGALYGTTVGGVGGYGTVFRIGCVSSTGWSFDAPTAVDDCSGTNVAITIVSTVTNSGPCPLIVARTWLVTDLCGNSNTCSQTVTVVDGTLPIITVCPTNIVICSSNGCGAMPNITNLVQATDNSGVIYISQSIAAGTALCSNTVVTLTVTDDCGNQAACTAPVIVGSATALITGYALAVDGFHIQFITQPGFSYTVEYTDSLFPATWLPLTTVFGDGTSHDAVDSGALVNTRFYRLRRLCP